MEAEINTKLSKTKLKTEINQTARSIHQLENQRLGLIAKGFDANVKAVQDNIRNLSAKYFALIGYYTSKGVITNDKDGICYIDKFRIKTPEELGPFCVSIFNEVKEKSEPVNSSTTLNNEVIEMSNVKTFVLPTNSIGIKYEMSAEALTAENKLVAEMKANVKLNKASRALVDNIEASVEANDRDAVFNDVRRYILAMAEYGAKVDNEGILTASSEWPLANEAATAILKHLASHATHDQAQAEKVIQAVAAAVDSTPEEEKKGWTHTITVQFKYAAGLAWNFVKGTISYLLNGAWKLLKTVGSICGFAVSSVLQFVDAATTKDFGASGQKGLILSYAETVATEAAGA